MKKKIKINPKVMKGFIEWSIRNTCLYGDAIEIWWKEKGCADFLKWAKEKGLLFNSERFKND